MMQVFQTPSDKTPALAPTPSLEYTKENVAPHSAQDSHLTHNPESHAAEPSSSESSAAASPCIKVCRSGDYFFFVWPG